MWSCERRGLLKLRKQIILQASGNSRGRSTRALCVVLEAGTTAGKGPLANWTVWKSLKTIQGCRLYELSSRLTWALWWSGCFGVVHTRSCSVHKPNKLICPLHWTSVDSFLSLVPYRHLFHPPRKSHTTGANLSNRMMKYLWTQTFIEPLLKSPTG